VLALLAILRPHNMVGTAAGVLCGYYLAGGRNPSETLVAVVVTAFVTGFGNVINDYYDLDIDRVNKPRRPLPSGLLSPRAVLAAYWASTAVLSLVALALLPPDWFALVVTWQALLFLYARYAKRTMLLGNVLIALIVSSAFIGGALFTGDLRAVAFPVSLSFLLVMGRELVKGGEDVQGDRAGGANTLAVRLGSERVACIGALILLACAVYAPLPGLREHYGRWYLGGMLVLFVPGLLFAAATLLRSPGRPALRRTSRILKLQMLVGVGVLWLAHL
jgi:geranylgeranylglycerol-phosphate geranylgeranyltransferase